MAVHELALLVTFYGVKVDTIASVTAIADDSSLQVRLSRFLSAVGLLNYSIGSACGHPRHAARTQPHRYASHSRRGCLPFARAARRRQNLVAQPDQPTRGNLVLHRALPARAVRADRPRKPS